MRMYAGMQGARCTTLCKQVCRMPRSMALYACMMFKYTALYSRCMHVCSMPLANGSSTCMQVLDENRGSGSYMETCPQRLPHICNDPSIMVVLLVNASAKGTVSSLDQLCCDITTVSASQCTWYTPMLSMKINIVPTHDQTSYPLLCLRTTCTQYLLCPANLLIFAGLT